MKNLEVHVWDGAADATTAQVVAGVFAGAVIGCPWQSDSARALSARRPRPRSCKPGRCSWRGSCSGWRCVTAQGRSRARGRARAAPLRALRPPSRDAMCAANGGALAPPRNASRSPVSWPCLWGCLRLAHAPGRTGVSRLSPGTAPCMTTPGAARAAPRPRTRARRSRARSARRRARRAARSWRVVAPCLVGQQLPLPAAER